MSYALHDGDDTVYPMAPIEFVCGSFTDPYIYFGDADIIFVFSSCMGSDIFQVGISHAIGRQCQPGTIVITTDYILPLHGYIPSNDSDTRIPYGNFKFRLILALFSYLTCMHS